MEIRIEDWKLKDCPCCGHVAKILEVTEEAMFPYTFYSVGCTHCTVSTDWLHKIEIAVNQWNARV